MRLKSWADVKNGAVSGNNLILPYLFQIHLPLVSEQIMTVSLHTQIQGVPGGMDKTSGECSLG
jgi:hypothetical protein